MPTTNRQGIAVVCAQGDRNSEDQEQPGPDEHPRVKPVETLAQPHASE